MDEKNLDQKNFWSKKFVGSKQILNQKQTLGSTKIHSWGHLHFDDFSSTPQLMLNRKWYQTSKQEMEFHIIDIIVHTRTNRKNNIFMQRQLYFDEAHMALDIFR